MNTLTLTPTTLKYYRPEYLRDARHYTNRLCRSLMKQWFPTPVQSVDIHPAKDEIYHNPVVMKMEGKEGFNKEGECNVCNAEVPESRQRDGCPVCKLARLHSSVVKSERSPKLSEEEFFKLYFKKQSHLISEMTDDELNLHLQEIIGIQTVIETARRKSRMTQGLLENEIVRRKPAKKIKGISVETTKGMSKLDKSLNSLLELGIDLSDIIK